MAGNLDIESAQQFIDAWNTAVENKVTFKDFAKALGIAPTNVAARRRRIQKLLGIRLESFTSTACSQAQKACRERLRQFSVTSKRPTAEDEIPIEELVAQRLKQTTRKLANDKLRELVEIDLDVTGPYAIAMFGDPHIDNPGCNLDLLLRHTKLVAGADGMLAICVGDMQDNWVGRLARLWAAQGIAARDSQRLVDWWLKQFKGKLIAVSEGNHDCWAHGQSGITPLAWIESQLGAVLEPHGVRLRLTPKDSDVPVTINMRHDFPGRSQYNAAHGPNKSLLFGCRDDVAVAGHTHEFGFGVRLDPETRRPMWAVRLGSYKHSDDYARTLGLLDNNVTECATLIVDPLEPDPRHRTWVELNPFRAAEILKQLRKERLGAEAKARRKPRARRG